MPRRINRFHTDPPPKPEPPPPPKLDMEAIQVKAMHIADQACPRGVIVRSLELRVPEGVDGLDFIVIYNTNQQQTVSLSTDELHENWEMFFRARLHPITAPAPPKPIGSQHNPPWTSRPQSPMTPYRRGGPCPHTIVTDGVHIEHLDDEQLKKVRDLIDQKVAKDMIKMGTPYNENDPYAKMMLQSKDQPFNNNNATHLQDAFRVAARARQDSKEFHQKYMNTP